MRRPAYDLDAVGIGWVHLGLGAFHRAHQALYADDLLARDPRWGIAAASLKSTGIHDALTRQDHLYSLTERGADGDACRVIGAVRRSFGGPAMRQDLLAAMTNPAVHLVTLTVTEKGWCRDASGGAVDLAHPDVAHDLNSPQDPASAPAVLIEALRRRRASGTAPFAVVPCDNIPDNGRIARRVVLSLARAIDPALADWIEEEVPFCATMVDRIVPATTADDLARAEGLLGCSDDVAVVGEPFRQWVIEDRFQGPRPDLASVGAELVSDVAPFEKMKLRLLNGAHSTLAYLGYLAGHETVADAIADTPFQSLVSEMMADEIAPTLQMPSGTDIGAYRSALLLRFANPALRHRTWQIAMDGSEKLPQRLLDTVRDRLAAGAPFERLALGTAGWMRYVTGFDEEGKPIDVRDPLAGRLQLSAPPATADAAAIVERYLGIASVFGDDLGAEPHFRDAVTSALHDLLAMGSKAVVRRHVAKG